MNLMNFSLKRCMEKSQAKGIERTLYQEDMVQAHDDAWKNPKQRELKVMNPAIMSPTLNFDAWKNPKQRELKGASVCFIPVERHGVMHGKIPSKGN